MTDVALVLLKLARLREFVALARRRRPEEAAVLATDVDRRDALALALLVALSEAVDVAMHMATDEGWGVPDSQRAAFDVLERHRVIDASVARALTGIVHVRNRIVHGYASVDHEKLWAELPAGLHALEAYAAAVASWIGANAAPVAG